MSYREDLLEAIKHILSQEEADFFPILATIKNFDTKVAVVLSYFINLSINQRTQNGWIHRTMEQISSETGLSMSEHKTARKILLECGILQEKRVFVSKMFRLDFTVLKDILLAKAKHEPL